MRIRPFILLGLISITLLLAPGCTHSGTFEVLVRNHTNSPLSVGLVKNGTPFETHWASPEELAMGRPDLADRHWGTLVPPNGTVTIGPTQGKFDSGVLAYLRVYRGDLSVDHLLAINRDAPDRMAIGLQPGKWSVDVIERDGRLTAVAPGEVKIDEK